MDPDRRGRDRRWDVSTDSPAESRGDVVFRVRPGSSGEGATALVRSVRPPGSQRARVRPPQSRKPRRPRSHPRETPVAPFRAAIATPPPRPRHAPGPMPGEQLPRPEGPDLVAEPETPIATPRTHTLEPPDFLTRRRAFEVACPMLEPSLARTPTSALSVKKGAATEIQVAPFDRAEVRGHHRRDFEAARAVTDSSTGSDSPWRTTMPSAASAWQPRNSRRAQPGVVLDAGAAHADGEHHAE